MPALVRVVLLVAIALALAAIVVLWRRIRFQEISRLRLIEPGSSGADPADLPPHRSFIQHYRPVPWMLALVVAAGLYFVVGLPAIFAGAFALVFGLLGAQVEALRVAHLTYLIEKQLADAIDLMVAALRAGAGASSALTSAAQESRRPLQPQLDELLGRIRYGDDPQMVLRALEACVPLETFRLFASALSVHWETGGSLAPTLATVGRVIRDRIEVNRRIRALTGQARTSTIAVLLVTYFLAAIIWRNDPDRMHKFLATSIGQSLAAGAIVLQAVGIVWSAALSRMKY